VLGIVKAHDGCITVESSPDRGSIFRVYLPLAADAAPRSEVREMESPALPAGLTVLVVEDEDLVRKMAGSMLRHFGMKVLEAKDGVEAVEVFGRSKNEIACVLCDLTMPRMNGWETIAALRELAPGIPVILASGYDEAGVMSDPHAERPQVFLAKPYFMATLKDALARSLASRTRQTPGNR
jgi:CheY-like chemotaxis protein